MLPLSPFSICNGPWHPLYSTYVLDSPHVQPLSSSPVNLADQTREPQSNCNRNDFQSKNRIVLVIVRESVLSTGGVPSGVLLTMEVGIRKRRGKGTEGTLLIYDH